MSSDREQAGCGNRTDVVVSVAQSMQWVNNIFHDKRDMWRKGAYPSTVASTTSLRIALLDGSESSLTSFT